MSGIGRRELVASGLAAGLLGQLPSALAKPPARRALRAPVRLVEATMLDVRARRQVRLMRDVMGSRVVALTFFFTGCSTVCPMQSASLARAQHVLGTLMGSKVIFASVSIDWFGDTPQAIEGFAQTHGAGRHWRFLKAPLPAVDAVRQGFDSFDPRRDDHPPVIAIGKVGAATWGRLYGLPTGDQVAAEVRAWLT